jgi:hypothetical protein
VVIGDAESLLKLCEAGTMRTGSIRFLVVDEVHAAFTAAFTASLLRTFSIRFLFVDVVHGAMCIYASSVCKGTI